MKEIALSIDVTEEKPVVRLYIESNQFDMITIPDQFCLSEKLLWSIDNLLKKNQMTTDNLTQIVVSPGPGSYTSLRIATTVANFLGFSLNVPVEPSMKKYDRKIFDAPVVPIYPHAPVITKRKARP